MPRYSRVVVKLSGEALAGDAGWGTDPQALAQLADEILSVHDLGVEIAVVIGARVPHNSGFLEVVVT